MNKKFFRKKVDFFLPSFTWTFRTSGTWFFGIPFEQKLVEKIVTLYCRVPVSSTFHDVKLRNFEHTLLKTYTVNNFEKNAKNIAYFFLQIGQASGLRIGGLIEKKRDTNKAIGIFHLMQFSMEDIQTIRFYAWNLEYNINLKRCWISIFSS